MSLAAFNTPHDYIFDFILHLKPFLFAQILSQLSHCPHTLLNVSLFIVFLHTIVRQMDESIINIIQRKLVSTETKIALVIKPDFRWVKILN